jgi:prepilin-type N-terminal cleavage/methylation domain-containing protein
MNFRFATIKNHNKLAKGFTIIELMVTIAIVVLVTGLIMIQYSSFNNSVLLRNQAYLTAFDVREAQALAVSVKGQGSEFREEYGLYFQMSAPSSYLLFQDDTVNGDHFPARFHTGEEVGVPYRVDPRFIIKDICATNSASRTCYSTDPSLSDLAISFRRPDFEASFYSLSKTSIQSAEIIFGTANGAITRSVIIYKTGQVSVD